MNLSELRPVPPSDGPNPLRDAALAYAKAGWRVFPAHGWRNQCCTCGDPGCDNPAKHPLTSHGLHDATVNEATIRRWWSQWPDANVAIRAEDIGVVVDVDPRNGGDESLDRIFRESGGMPDTVEVLTGGGGNHFYLRTPHPVAKGKLPSYPGIDIQAAGSYVIAPPSMHKSGQRYEFEASSDWTLGQRIADCPAWILELRGEQATRIKSDRPVPPLSEPPPGALVDLQEALRFLDPDMDYPEWVKVGQAIHGALWSCGFEAWDQWSAQGTKYPGPKKMRAKWGSFDANGAITLATVYGMARDAGRQWKAPEAPGAFAPPPAGESLVIMARDLPTTLKPPAWLARHYIEANALSVLFGEPGAGKSFLALDLGLSIATGTTWHGNRVKQTPVVYLCGEGWGGLQRRMHAWRDWHQVDWRPAPFALTKHAIPLGNRQAAEALKRDVDGIVDQLGDVPGLFIVDTLARNFGAGDENSTKDMSLFIDHVGAYLMDAYKAGVMLVHHTGHGDKQRARGSSSLKGAVDAEYFVAKGEAGIVELSGLKMKDAILPPTLYFGMRVVDLGIRDEDGEAITSVVPVPTGAPGESTLKPPPSRERAPAQGQILDLLRELQARSKANLVAGGFDPTGARVPVEDWRDEAIARRIVNTRQNFFRLKSALLEQGVVLVDKGIARLLDEEGASTDA
jgi:hypothetical protein